GRRSAGSRERPAADGPGNKGRSAGDGTASCADHTDGESPGTDARKTRTEVAEPALPHPCLAHYARQRMGILIFGGLNEWIQTAYAHQTRGQECPHDFFISAGQGRHTFNVSASEQLLPLPRGRQFDGVQFRACPTVACPWRAQAPVSLFRS